ncbi:pectate lyase [soil metagenome]
METLDFFTKRRCGRIRLPLNLFDYIMHPTPFSSLLLFFFSVLSDLALASCKSTPGPVAAELGTAAPAPGLAPALAFPGAEGFGKYTTGGRGGKVLIVSNLNDSGPGSLREAIKQKEPRTIVFAVSGTIALEAPLDINTGDLTIAGQSAPGEGICLRNYPLKISADNVIVRYLRVRMGDEQEQEADAMTGLKNKDIIIDHCSFSWGTDEVATFYDNENFTLQWSIISESLNASVHAKGEHGYGGIWGGKGASFHHNLLAHHKSRNPRFNGARYHKEPALEIVDFRNNVIYNWKANSAYGGEEGNHNVVNNYYKPGPATEKSKNSRILNPDPPYGTFYVAGNYVAGNPEVTKNNRLGVEGKEPEKALVPAPVPVVSLPERAAAEAYEQVLARAGASFRRDALDERVIREVRSGQATFGKNKDGIIDSQQEVGGWPTLQSAPAPEDQDQDGMPDAWERQHQLNPNRPDDAAAYSLDQRYTNIEIYLNSLVAEKGGEPK